MKGTKFNSQLLTNSVCSFTLYGVCGFTLKSHWFFFEKMTICFLLTLRIIVPDYSIETVFLLSNTEI